MNRRRGLKAAALAAVFCIIVVASLNAYWRYYPVESGLFEMSVLDVGQGDAILLETPTGQTVLIDGGPDKKVLTRLGEELPFWEHRIDLVVVSHPHEDHIAGLIPVLERYEVGALMITGIQTKSATYARLLEVASARNVPLFIADSPRRLEFGGLNLSLLFPQTSLSGKRIANLNNSSIVVKATYGTIDILLTGDAEEIEEKQLLAAKVDLSAEILKAGHHGSETSSSEAFVKAVNPKLALISDGTGNSYGHPSPRTLKRFERLGIQTRRTDLEGTIHVMSDGKTFTLR